jgi:hypothetical protein
MNPHDIASLIEPAAIAAIVGLVTWLVRRVFTYTIPRLAEDFKEALNNQQKQFLHQLELQRDDFKGALEAQRSDFKETLKDERDQLGHELNRLSTAVEALLER